jgi:flagellar basal-body rod protein FlgG
MILQGLLAAASGMEAEQAQLDAVSNDIANIDTPGYQSEVLGFHDLLYQSVGPGNGTTQATGDGAEAQVVGRDQAPGSIVTTGRWLDVAIQGPGFLEVRRPDGTIGLTRNGSLQLNANRELTNQEGMPLVPPLTIPNGVADNQVGIAPDGTVQVQGRTIGRISLVTVPAPDKLLNAGDSTLTANAASGAIRPLSATTLMQGALEYSNVDMSTAVSKMIDAQTSYSMDSRAIQMQDQMMQIANQIGPR